MALSTAHGRARGIGGSSPASAGSTDDDDYQAETFARPSGSSSVERYRWRASGLFGAGLALGLAIGAGTAFLLAPMSGEDTREYLGERARHYGDRLVDRWDGLRGEVSWMGRQGRKRLRRGMVRGRWTAEDVVDRGRRRFS